MNVGAHSAHEQTASRPHVVADEPALVTGRPTGAAISATWFEALYETPLLFSGILDAQGRVLDANRLAVEGCGLARDEVIGRHLWEGGWWNGDEALAAQVQRWCEEVVRTGRPVRTTSRYFLGDGTARTADLTLYPVPADRSTGADVGYIIVTGSDITDAVTARAERERRMQIEAEGRRQAELAQRRELELVVQAEVRVRERLARLAGAALDMVGAQSIEDLTAILFSRGVPVLGADGGALILRDGDELLFTARDRVHGRGAPVFRRQPADGPLPGPYVARTGRRVILPNRAAGLAFASEMAAIYEETDRHAAAIVPLEIGGRILGALAIFWIEEREITDDDVALIEAFAAQCAQTVERINATVARAEATREVQRMVESLQASLLRRPATASTIEVATLYRPAVRQLRVGGDWHDAFTTRSGATVLSIGDVAGHDGHSVSTMAQLRSILRGLAVDGEDPPATMLSRLDRAMAQLSLEAIVTAIVARVEPPAEPASGEPDGLVVQWSSAGHPPPLRRAADGAVDVLAPPPELLLGVDPDTPRHDHQLALAPGDILLLYTDGLVERREEVISDGIARLQRRLAAVAVDDMAAMLGVLADELLPEGPDDDVAMLAIRQGR